MVQLKKYEGNEDWDLKSSSYVLCAGFFCTLCVVITPGSKASQANLCPGDVIVAIDGYGTEDMTHNDAQERIKAASHQLCLKIERAETKLWSPQITEDGKPHPFKVNLEAEPQGIVLTDVIPDNDYSIEGPEEFMLERGEVERENM
ncbi:UNVERIFIED_CONTAM: hypothetical protein K2H54_054944 [Gekko kuhli]